MAKEKYSRLNPLNREHAFALQLQDDVKLLTSIATLTPESFEEQLKKIETTIFIYRNRKY